MAGAVPDAARPRASGPDFICFGMQRAGTRWLYDQLSSHPDIWMPPVKEIGHFVDDCFKPSNLETERKYPRLPSVPAHDAERAAFWRMFTPERREKSGDRWYLDLFEPKDGRRSGDISPEYAALLPARIRAVYRLCPEARYAMLIRDPVERFWSAATMHARKGRHRTGALQDRAAIAGLLSRPLYARRSYPSRIWEAWRSTVPERQCAFFFFDDVRDRPRAARAAIFRFIGVDATETGIDPDLNRKAGQQRESPDPEIGRDLTVHFLPEYEACARLFGGHAERWLDVARDRLK